MKSTELKIGNLVEDYKGSIIEVLPNDILALYQTEIAGTDNIIYFPLEITEELLIKIGFTLSGHEKSKKAFLKATENIHIEYDFIENELNIFYDNNLFSIFADNYSNIVLRHIKYIHQVQNLYSVLCHENKY